MSIFFIIVVIVIIIALAKSNPAPPKKEAPPPAKPYDFEAEKRVFNSIAREDDAHEYEHRDVFRCHIGVGISDMSHLSPSEARAEMKERKADGEYIPSSEYRGYMDVIASANDDKYLDQMEYLTSEKLSKWFNKKVASGAKMSTNIWFKVESKLAPFQEADLLEELLTIRPARVPGWVQKKKSEGFFFTEHAYAKARERYETPLRAKAERAERLKERASIEIPQEIYLRANEALSKAPVPDDVEKAKSNLKRYIRDYRKKMEADPTNENTKQRYLENVAKYQVLTGEDYF